MAARTSLKATGERQIQTRDNNTGGAPPARSGTSYGGLTLFTHESKDAAKDVGQEVRDSNYAIKNINVPEICNKCGAVCKPKKCKKCQKVIYCSSECQRADWEMHKPICKALVLALNPSEHVIEKAVLKLSTRMIGDIDFLEQINSIACASLALYQHPERGRTHVVNFLWDLVPLRTANEYRQDLPAKQRMTERGKQRYMLELVSVRADSIPRLPLAERNALAQRRSEYMEGIRKELRDRGAAEDYMDKCHHIPLCFFYKKVAESGREPLTSMIHTALDPDLVALKHKAMMGDISKLAEMSGKIVNENDSIRYAIRLLNSQIITSQSGRNFRTSISMDEAEGDD